VRFLKVFLKDLVLIGGIVPHNEYQTP